MQSTYIQRPGADPSGILTKYGEVSRAKIMGVVVSKEDPKQCVVDDGSGSIIIRSFDRPIDVSLGEIIMVIGRPREWESSKYLAPEIAEKIDKQWIEVHKREIRLNQLTTAVKLPVAHDEPEFEQADLGPYQKILNVIAILDKGNGADIDEIISHVKIDNCEAIIKSLLEAGEIFEFSPGKVKLL
ncbi:MAG: hypothetical protein HGA85_01865 [Nanoarchaeota archaeon]|nr:hypothetical protein [Nanoarchaeota archaeon]